MQKRNFNQIVLAIVFSAFASISTADTEKNQLVNVLQSALSDTHTFEDEFVGQVWLASMSDPLSRWIKDTEERVKLLTMIHAEASRTGLEPGLILALIQVESAFDGYAISYAGARGIMQVMPFWKKEIGRDEDNLLDVATNLRYGTTILAHYIELEKGSVIKGLARYNGSRGQTWYPKRVLTYWNQYWRMGE
jgi:soluble lytic murein transglycosylase-like protein